MKDNLLRPRDASLGSDKLSLGPPLESKIFAFPLIYLVFLDKVIFFQVF